MGEPTRLDRFINRLLAQRSCLNDAAARLSSMPGPLLELGLGNGRTYSHMRALWPDRDIYVFERRYEPHPDSVPPENCLILGDFRDTIPAAAHRLGAPAVLVHADFGSANTEATLRMGEFLAQHIPPLLAKGGYVLTDQPLALGQDFARLPLPVGCPPGTYHYWRKSA